MKNHTTILILICQYGMIDRGSSRAFLKNKMNYAHQELEGKIVSVNKKHFKPEFYKDIEQGFMCEGGFGCHTGTYGESIYGYWVATKEKDKISGRDTVRVIEKATSPEVA